MNTKGIFIISAKRTPFCKHGGILRALPASQAFAAASRDAIFSAYVDTRLIDSTVVGNVHFLSQCDGGKTARYCGLYSGVPVKKPALAVNRTCGSGIQAVVSGAIDIFTGVSNMSLTGGTEIMSNLPHLVRHVRFGTPLGAYRQMEDYIQPEFIDSYTGISLERAAEESAKKFGVTRKETDEYAVESYLKWKKAQEANKFRAELSSVVVHMNKKEVFVDKDDVQSKTLAELEQLRAILGDGSIVTTGNRAAPADGASALILANDHTAQAHSLTPLARVAAWCATGISAGAATTPAVAVVKKLLQKQRLQCEDVDLFEINESFASEILIAIRHLRLDPAKVNVSGGALVLGHPVSASGARMITHLVHQLKTGKIKRAIAASSCGGEQGIAILLERP